MLSFAGFVVVVTAVFSISPYTFVRDTLEDKLTKRGEAWLETLHDPVGDYQTLELIKIYLAEFPKDLPEVSYTALVDDKGVFLAHTDPSLVGKPWSVKNSGGTGRNHASFRGERSPGGVGSSPCGGKNGRDDPHRAQLPRGGQHPCEAG